MGSLSWDASLETGDPLVDQQHRAIHHLVDQVEAATDGPEQLMAALDQLMEYVDCHFTTEEALMAATGYAGEEADEHVAEHRELTSRARDLVLAFSRGGLTTMEPMVELLRPWLANHVHGRDREFVAYVRARGATAVLPEPWASDPLTYGGVDE